MTSRDFCYWLQGFFEIQNAAGAPLVPGPGINPSQTDMIKKHLALVFKHEIDPSYGDEAHQKELNEIHNPEPKKPSAPPHLRPTVYRC